MAGAKRRRGERQRQAASVQRRSAGIAIGTSLEATDERALQARDRAAWERELDDEEAESEVDEDEYPNGADDEWDVSEYDGDLEEEPEPAPDESPHRWAECGGRRRVAPLRAQAEPALSIDRCGEAVTVSVRALGPSAAKRGALLRLVGSFLTERYGSALMSEEPGGSEAGIPVGQASQTDLLAYVTGRWHGPGALPNKSEVSKLLGFTIVRISGRGERPLGDFFVRDLRRTRSGRKADNARIAEAIGVALERQPDLSDAELAQCAMRTLGLDRQPSAKAIEGIRRRAGIASRRRRGRRG